MSILRKPYEISLWTDEWDSTESKFKEKRIMTIGSSDMEYQGRAIEPNLIRKTNGEVSFSFKMYYQFVDTITGEDIHNPFVDQITNESKIKLKYKDEWFDLLVKNITKDSATKSYSYQLVDQHMVELSKNGFNIELDSKLMNNLGTAEELAAKVLADTGWGVDSEKIVATQDEALVMLKVGSDGISAYQINDTDLTNYGAEPKTSTTFISAGENIYAFYSACSGDKPYRFQFIYFTGPFEIQSDRIITTRNCQYLIDGIDPKNGWWTGNENAEGKELETGFTVPKGLWVDTEYEGSDGNETAISMKYRGRRYVYTQTSEYHAGLDMYLEKYRGFANNRVSYYKRTASEQTWNNYGKEGYEGGWLYYEKGERPEEANVYHIGDIVEITHSTLSSIYVQVLKSLYSEVNSSGKTVYRYQAKTIDSAKALEYYKYTQTNYVTPNLIQNVVTNADFKGTTGWEGGKFVSDNDIIISSLTPLVTYTQSNTVWNRNYTKETWDRYTMPGRVAPWDIGANNEVKQGEWFTFVNCTIGDKDKKTIYPILYAIQGCALNEKMCQAKAFGYVEGSITAKKVNRYTTTPYDNPITTKNSPEQWIKFYNQCETSGAAIGGREHPAGLNENDYIYLTNCYKTNGETQEKFFPYFQVLGYLGGMYWRLRYLGEATEEKNIPLMPPFGFSIKTSSPEYQPTLESTSMKKITEGSDSSFVSAIDEIISGNTVIGDSDYSSYLLCKNLQSIGALDSKDYVRKIIINNGFSSSTAFPNGVTKGEKYRFKLDFYVLKKTTSYTDTGTTITYDDASKSKQVIDFKIANFDYSAQRHGYDINKADAALNDSEVLFYTLITMSHKGTQPFSCEVDLEANCSLTAKAIEQSKYRMFLEFKDFEVSEVSKPASGATESGTYVDYYVLIQNCEFYKLYPNNSGGYYTPEDNINADNISFNIEEKYFPVANDKAKKEEIAFINRDNFKQLIPILSSDASRKSCVNVKESNYFNIIQSIAETFECWPKFIVGHNDNGKITTKTVKFFNYVGQENHASFKYGVNSKDIKRTIDSNQIVSKLIVKANSNEYAPNGFCSIARSPANTTKDNIIYDFGYYANTGLINATSLQRDLYDYEPGWTLAKLNNKTDGEIGGFYITTLLDENSVGNYISSCSGYYSKMSCINTRLAKLSDLISQNSAPLNEAVAKYDTYNTLYETAQVELKDAQDRFYKLAGFAYDAIPEGEHNRIIESDTLYPILQTIAELAVTEANSETQYLKAKKEKEQCEAALEILKIQEKNALFLKATLNKLFYQRYSRFIQEGTWIDESYIDESLYYNDALSVSYNSSRPKVTYSMNVIALAGLPGYELFDFKIGDQTFVEDGEFFGYDDNGNPHQEKVTITQTSENLDDPSKNTIQIRNYENQFEDLFQRITATVQSVQYTEGAYKKASALAEADAAHKFSFLTDALSGIDSMIISTDNIVEIDTAGGKGITITNKNDKTQALRLTSGAILLQDTDPDTGNKIWKTGLTAQGISASLVTAGIVNTGEIQIMNGDEPTFRWDSHGITAYDFDNSASDVWLAGINKNKGVRFDRFGLYGYKLPKDGVLTGENWKPTGIYTGVNSIEEHSTFYLTWEGLKVKNSNGAILRIGDNSKVDSNDKSIFKVVDDKGIVRMNITENGNIQATGLTLTSSTVEGYALTSDVDKKISSAIEELDLPDDLDQFLTSDDLQISTTIGANGITTITVKDKNGNNISSTTIGEKYIATDVGLGTGQIKDGKKFILEADGTLNADNAIIHGQIFANEGYIAGWHISQIKSNNNYSGSLTYGDLGGTTGFHMYGNNYGVTGTIAGKTVSNTTSSTNPGWKLGIGSNFGVTSDGAIYATAGKIGNMIIDTNGEYSWRFSPTDGMYMWKGTQADDNLVLKVDNRGLSVNGIISCQLGYSLESWLPKQMPEINDQGKYTTTFTASGTVLSAQVRDGSFKIAGSNSVNQPQVSFNGNKITVTATGDTRAIFTYIIDYACTSTTENGTQLLYTGTDAVYIHRVKAGSWHITDEHPDGDGTEGAIYYEGRQSWEGGGYSHSQVRLTPKGLELKYWDGDDWTTRGIFWGTLFRMVETWAKESGRANEIY